MNYLRSFVGCLMAVIFVGCAGSPNIRVNKNIYVLINGVEEEEGKRITELPYPIFISIYYNTESTTESDADISQEGELKIPTP